MNARIINVRFNLDKEKHRQAWAALQQLRQEKGWSYSESFSEALVAFIANGFRDGRTEEEIGRNSPRPCSRPSSAASMIFMRCLLSDDRKFHDSIAHSAGGVHVFFVRKRICDTQGLREAMFFAERMHHSPPTCII